MKIFISYRRDDTLAIAGRVYDRLSNVFGAGTVFRDLDAVPAGEDFREVVQDAISESNVVVALIGHDWLGSNDACNRLENPKDFVRAEIEAALNLQIPVIPVLLDGAIMPSEETLPTSLARLPFRNALELDCGKDFDLHVDRLVNAIELIAKKKRTKSHSLIKTVVISRTGLAILVGLGICLTGAALIVAAFLPVGFWGDNPANKHGTNAEKTSSPPESKRNALKQDRDPYEKEGETKKAPTDTPAKPDQKSIRQDELIAQITAKKDELGRLLVNTVVPRSTPAGSKVTVSTNGDQIIITVVVETNNLYNGTEITASVSTRGIEDIRARKGNELIRIDGREVDEAKFLSKRILGK